MHVVQPSRLPGHDVVQPSGLPGHDVVQPSRLPGQARRLHHEHAGPSTFPIQPRQGQDIFGLRRSKGVGSE